MYIIYSRDYSARNLGVIFDNHMSLDKQVNSICSQHLFILETLIVLGTY